MASKSNQPSGWFWINLLLLFALYAYDAISAIKPNGRVPLSSILFSAYDILVVLFAARGGCLSRGLFWINTALCTLAMLVFVAAPYIMPERELDKLGARLIVGTVVAVIAIWLLHVTFLFQLKGRARARR